MSQRRSVPVPSTPCGRRTNAGGQCAIRVRGGGPCRVHGGAAPQVKRKRLERIALAEALAADPRRHPSEVLGDVLHQADHLMRRAREEVDAEKPTAETMVKLLDLTEHAGRWAKTSLDAEVDQRQTRVLEAQAAALAAVITRVLDRLELSLEQRELVTVVVPEELERMSAGELEAGRGR